MTTPRPLPRLDASREAEAVRDALWAKGYTSERVAERESCADIYDVWTIGHRDNPARPIDDALDALIRLFLDIKPMPSGALRAHLGGALVDGLVALGLLRQSDDGYCATALLYPNETVLVASDIPIAMGEAPVADAVYPAITPNTRAFLRALPKTPCERFLELCAGTGVAALQAAPRAGHAWATDLTERSTHFARFNAMLNGLPNVTAAAGDLYDPVAGATFDRIAVHPPYVASAERVMIYRDGGEDGESVTRRVIQGVPAHLAPGGVCYCTCVATDRTGAPLESRLREWLDAKDLDVMIAVVSAWEPRDRFPKLVAQGSMTEEEAERVLQNFERMGIERQVYASIAIRRHRATHAPVTVRRQLGKPEDPAAIAQMVQWQSELAEDDALPGVLSLRPRMAGGTARHTIDQVVNSGGSWQPSVRQLVREHPFLVRADYDPAVDALLARVDGVQSIRDHWQAMRRDGLIPDTVEMAAFAAIVRWLAASGIIDTNA